MIEKFVKDALIEDIGRGDLFAFAPSKNVKATIKAKQSGILSGVLYAKTLLEISKVDFQFHFEDGDSIKFGDDIVSIFGNSSTILSIERTLLNLMQHSSGIATLTRTYKSKLNKTKLLDTRKTRPNMRIFEKYSTRVGGACNHRMGLDDAIMLKDTHLAIVDNIEEFLRTARANIPFTTKIEIECESVEFAKDVMNMDCDIIMCDNMTNDNIKRVVDYKNQIGSNKIIEASGNITLDNIATFDDLGLDAISVGSIIHQATWLDFSMKIKDTNSN
jgi:nicotinate-nucleotide pyrophosphorylase (carboxylating)